MDLVETAVKGTAMKTYMAKPAEVVRQWYVVDATDKTVGRLAVKLARILMGKHRATYTPHVDSGDFVIVVNAGKVRFTGNKWKTKLYKRYTGYPGGLWHEEANRLRDRKPTEILKLAVRRMLPKNKLSYQMLRKLKLYAGPDHPHQAQNPKPLDLAL
jgi:large subunit ribosomal protein L13